MPAFVSNGDDQDRVVAVDIDNAERKASENHLSEAAPQGHADSSIPSHRPNCALHIFEKRAS
jgi:hypothetical protein